MQELAQEINRLARQIQRDLAELPDGSTDPTDPNQSTDSTGCLARIEHKLDSIHDDTGELVRRVPKDLSGILESLKEQLLSRLTVPTQPNEPNRSAPHPSADAPTQSTGSVTEIVKSMTPQERNIFQLCFQLGFLSYRDIADHLEITASAAKNLVNRIFQSDAKRPLFVKQYKHGAARVGVRTELKERILHGRDTRKQKPVVAATRDQG